MKFDWVYKYSDDSKLADVVNNAIDDSSHNAIGHMARALKKIGFASDINDAVFGFLNSDSMRNYLREINYKFSSAEASWIVFNCKRRSFIEKVCMQAIIATKMPESSCVSDAWQQNWLKDKGYAGINDVINSLLLNYLKDANEFFNEGGNNIYRYRFTGSAPREFYSLSDEVYLNSDSCIIDAISAGEAFECCNKELVIAEVQKDSLAKSTSDATANYGWVEFCDGVLVDFRYGGGIEQEFTFCDVFDQMRLSIPSPFKKGDIVYDLFNFGVDTDFENGLKVVKQSSCEGCLESGYKGLDAQDMSITVFNQEPNGSFFESSASNYMDMEFFPKHAYVGKQRIMLALSALLKDEIDIELYSDAILEFALRDISKIYEVDLKKFSKSNLQSAGVIDRAA